jgi:hypothetical protein
MTWLKDAVLAAFRWAREMLRALFDTVYDPPPRTIRFWFWSFAAVAAVCWITFAFVNSWYYRPTAQYFAEFSHTWLGDDGDVVLPEHEEPLPTVALPAIEVPIPAVVCHDASDTPHCETVAEAGIPVSEQVQEVTPPVAKPPVGYKAKKSPTGYKRRKHQPYQTYWGF